MISLEKQHIALSLARYQQVDDSPRVRSAIDVITEEDLNCIGYRARPEILVDTREKLCQEVGAPVYISDGINAPADGDTRPRFGRVCCQQFPRQDILLPNNYGLPPPTKTFKYAAISHRLAEFEWMMLVALTSPATVMRRLFELLAVPNRRALLKDKSRSVVRQLPPLPNRTNHARAATRPLTG
jgi:hypothetical protein